MTSSATWMTAPSTQPPLTAPETSPLELIAIFAPGGLGAERLTLTTIAMRDLVAARGPGVDVVQDVLHRVSSRIVASSASEASELPARK